MHNGAAKKVVQSRNVNMPECAKLSVISHYLPFSGGKNKSVFYHDPALPYSVRALNIGLAY